MKPCGHHHMGKSYCQAWCDDCVAFAIHGLRKNKRRATAETWLGQIEAANGKDRRDQIAGMANQLWQGGA